MTSLVVRAYAKLNLTLDVLGKRDDGYHDIISIMQSVSLSDLVQLDLLEGSGIELSITGNDFLPTDERNTAYAAATKFCRKMSADAGRLRIKIEKNIPACAGLAGGSADAAAVLNGMNRIYGEYRLPFADLSKLASEIGSDVPFCLRGGTALCEGRGDVIREIPDLPPSFFVLVKPDFSVSTPELYHAIDHRKVICHPYHDSMLQNILSGNTAGVAQLLYNVFEDVLDSRAKSVVSDIKKRLLYEGAAGASMTGTGSVVYGMFENEQTAANAAQNLQSYYPHYTCYTAYTKGRTENAN